MPSIDELPADTAPDDADLFPFYDVSVGRTEHVTKRNLATAIGAADGIGINATVYGVTADGTTDDTAAWAAAIAAADTAGVPLIVPEGTSIVTGIDLPTGFTLIGQGIKSIIKLAASATRGAIELESATTQGVTISNLVIDGNKANQSSSDARGLNLINQDETFPSPWATYMSDAYHHVTDVTVMNCKGNGVHIAGRGDSHFTRVHSYLNDGDGFYVIGFDLWFTDCIAGVSLGDGFDVPGWNNTFTGCKAFLSRVDDYNITGHYCRFTNCVSQGAYRYGFLLYLAEHCVVSSLTVIDADYEANGTGNCLQIHGGAYNIVEATVANIEASPTPQYGVYFNTTGTSNRVDVTGDPDDFAVALVGGTTEGCRLRVNGGDGYMETTYAATVAPDMALGWVHQITLTGNITINRPTNFREGDILTMIFLQDGTGSRTVTWGSGFPDKTWTPTATADSVSVARFVAYNNNFYRMT